MASLHTVRHPATAISRLCLFSAIGVLASLLALVVPITVLAQVAAEADGENGNEPAVDAREAAKKKKRKPPPVRMEVVVGQDGRVRMGELTPIQVTLDNDKDSVEGVILVTSGRMRTQMPFSLPRGGHKRYTLYVRLYGSEFGDPVECDVRLLRGRRLLNRETITPKIQGVGGRLIVTCTAEGSGLKYLNGLTLNPPSDEEPTDPSRNSIQYQSQYTPGLEDIRIRVRTVSTADMPRWWAGYEPADAVVISGQAWSELDADQRRALRMWVHSGGRAILTTEDSTEWRDPEGAALSPVTPTGVRPRMRLDCLAELAGSPYVPGRSGLTTVTGQPSPTAGLRNRTLFEDGSPMVVHTEAVLGDVVWMGFDPHRAGFRDWTGNEAFWRAILQLKRYPAPFAPLYDHSSIQEIAGALPTLKAPPRMAILLFAVGYTLIFGPINILLLRRFRRTVRAWLCMPFIAVGMTGALLLVGQLSGKARTVVSSVTVLHANSGARTAWQQELIGLFSPINRRFSVVARDPATEFQQFRTNSSARIIHEKPEPTRDPFGTVIAQLPKQLVWPDEQDSVRTGEVLTRWRHQALGLYSAMFLYGQKPADLGAGIRVDLLPDGSGEIVNGSAYRLRDAYLRIGDQRIVIGELSPSARSRFAPEDWGEYEPRARAVAGADDLRENRLFTNGITRLQDRAVARIVKREERRGAWLVASLDDVDSVVEIEDQPLSNRAAVLLMRVPAPQRLTRRLLAR